MKRHGDLAFLTERPIAHRGLHDAARGIHENSLSAFAAAIEHGYAIECDVRLSSDGVPMVFHDAELNRMVGKPGLLQFHSADDLGKLRLKDTEDRVPRLADLIDLAAGQVPLVVELKGVDPLSDRSFADRLRPLLEAYRGPLALMSFDDWLVDQALTVSAGVPVGLTAEGTRPEVLERHKSVFADRCSFTSYNVHHLDNAFVRFVRDEKGLPVISWTVRNETEARTSARHADQITFEGFLP